MISPDLVFGISLFMNIESGPILSTKAAAVFQALTENLQYHRLLDCLEAAVFPANQ